MDYLLARIATYLELGQDLVLSRIIQSSGYDDTSKIFQITLLPNQTPPLGFEQYLTPSQQENTNSTEAPTYQFHLPEDTTCNALNSFLLQLVSQ